MDRRTLLKTAAATGAAAALPRAAFAQAAAFAPKPAGWRAFELTTRLDLPADGAQAWIPLPSLVESQWMKPVATEFSAPGATSARIVADPRYGAAMLHVVFPKGAPGSAEITNRFETRDRAVAPDGAAGATPLSARERALYLNPTALIPTDGIVRETSDRIVAGVTGDVARARAIYEWVVENTFRDAATRGCGVGDIAALLRSGRLGGKCADINALFVGLARAAGLPARDVYGLRVAPSKFGYKSLGANAEIVSKAQHCRAEVYLEGAGWTPVDPADVRKVALEEVAGGLPLSDAKVAAARKTLFGAWEGNWVAYNVAHDVTLPGAAGPAVDFLMYPQAEVAGARLDCLDPDTFRYVIRAREIAV